MAEIIGRPILAQAEDILRFAGNDFLIHEEWGWFRPEYRIELSPALYDVLVAYCQYDPEVSVRDLLISGLGAGLSALVRTMARNMREGRK